MRGYRKTTMHNHMLSSKNICTTTKPYQTSFLIKMIINSNPMKSPTSKMCDFILLINNILYIDVPSMSA